MLFERGLWRPGMRKGDMAEALNKCSDFMNETSAFEDELASWGHYGVLSPKVHPELAGQGVEYCWGKGKLHFRRNNTMYNKTFEKRVIEAMDT